MKGMKNGRRREGKEEKIWIKGDKEGRNKAGENRERRKQQM